MRQVRRFFAAGVPLSLNGVYRVKGRVLPVAGEKGFPLLPDTLVNVHTGTVIPKKGFRHEGCGFIMSPGHIFYDVFVPHETVRAND